MIQQPPAKPVAPGLYIVATPIGNLRDITLRALDILAAADLILAEDTRVGAKLLAAYGLKKPLERYDDHAGERARPKAFAALEAGQIVALISDAGTPLISDPGYRLAREAADRGLPVRPAPGPSSVLAALSAAGLATDRFLFGGFLPNKAKARRDVLTEFKALRATLAFFESGPRLRDSLADMADILGPRRAVVARELTKLFETFVRGTLTELAADPACDAPRGEIVVLIEAAQDAAMAAADAEAVLREALSRMSLSAAAAEAARLTGLSKRDLYSLALSLKAQATEDP